MATTNSAVTITAGLSTNALVTPQIGMQTSHAMSYTDGDSASDTYVNCATITGTAINADIVGGGYLLVSNPSANTYGVTLKISSTVIGTLVPGGMALLPLDSGTVITGVSLTAAQNVGVTVIECDQNA